MTKYNLHLILHRCWDSHAVLGFKSFRHVNQAARLAESERLRLQRPERREPFCKSARETSLPNPKSFDSRRSRRGVHNALQPRADFLAPRTTGSSQNAAGLFSDVFHRLPFQGGILTLLS